MRLQAWAEGLWDSEDGIPASENEWGLPRFTPIRTHIHLKKLWAKALLPIGRVTMAKKKTQPGFAICGQCAEVIDLKALNLAIAEDRPYVHYCGRVLHWGGNESEVPTGDLDDSHTSTSPSSSPSTGDA